MTWDAFVYNSGTICDQIWMDWDIYCAYDWTDDCSELSDMMYESDDEIEIDWMLATKSSSTQSSASFGADFGKGAAIGAIAALTTLYAASKCIGSSKSAGSEDFQRA